MSTPITTCGVCGSKNLTDLGHGNGLASIICHDCKAHWWQKWYSLNEWNKWIDEEWTAWLEDESPD